MKKFYKLVSPHQEGDHYHIHLDGRPVKCPSGTVLAAPTKQLADAIVLEWAAQEEEIKPDTMPLTQILTTCIDRVSMERPAMEAALLKYFDTDLICYRAGDDPPGQREAQEQAWDEWINWFSEHFGETLKTTTEIAAISQDKSAYEKVASYVKLLDDNRFTAFQLVVSASGSLILGLAFAEGDITPQQIFDAAHVEEHFKASIYNEEKYGAAPHEEKKRADMLRDLEASESYMQLL